MEAAWPAGGLDASVGSGFGTAASRASSRASCRSSESFAPYVAGVARMERDNFSFYNTLGGAAWVIALVIAGFVFGNVAWVQAHLNHIIWALVLLPGTVTPYGAWRARQRRHEP